MTKGDDEVKFNENLNCIIIHFFVCLNYCHNEIGRKLNVQVTKIFFPGQMDSN